MKTSLITSTILTILSVIQFLACSDRDEIQINQPIYYLALGDSYTIGQGVEESQRWPNQLSKKLEDNNYEVIKTEIIAQTGWKTGDLLNTLSETKLEGYNLVSLLIGVNNQFWGQPFEIFKTELDSLLKKSIELAGGKKNVFVLSIPDYGVAPFRSNNGEQIAKEIDMYNNYIKLKCIEQDILFVDITETSRELGDATGSLGSDNFHPSGFQYAKWVEKVLPEVIQILIE